MGEYRGRLFLNFTSSVAAERAVKVLNGYQLSKEPAASLSACIKGSGFRSSGGQHVNVTASSQGTAGQTISSGMVSADCTVIIMVRQGTQPRELEQLVAAWNPGGQFACAGAVGVSSKLPLIYVNFGDSAQASAAVQSFIRAYSSSGHSASLKSAHASRQISSVHHLITHDIEAAQKAARQEIPALHLAIAALSIPIPPFAEPTTPSDIVIVPPGSQEFEMVQALCEAKPLHRIKKVNVTYRQARVEAWKRHLPPAYQQTTQVA